MMSNVLLNVSTAIFGGNPEEMRKLVLSNDINVNEEEEASHLTLLIKAAVANDETVIRTLVDLGGDVNKAIEDGRTPMLTAALMNHVLAIQVLHELGADINFPDKNGASPTCIAASMGNLEATKALAGLGADIDITDYEGMTPIHAAAKYGRDSVVMALAEMGADIDTTSFDNVSPHCTAVRRGRTEIADFLVSMGADLMTSLDHFEDADAFAGVHKMVLDFAQMATAGDCSVVTVCALLALTKILTSVVSEATRRLANGDKAAETGEGVREISFVAGVPEAEVTKVLRSVLSHHALENIRQVPYPLKRRVARIAWRVVREGTAALDSDRVTTETMVRRYVEVYCLFHNPVMMHELLSLRMTCKSNHAVGRRRFPVRRPHYHELEAYMIEEWVAYPSSRFVSTEVLHVVSRMNIESPHGR